MKTQKESNILNISDLDQKIYRIISITRFKELIKNRELVLVNPEKWDVVFEEHHAKDEKHAFDFTFLTFIKANCNS